MDPQLVDGWVMLARIRLAEGRRADAEEALRAAVAANPGDRGLAALLEDLYRN
jgi:cytochrome c-type biogenesis protein CcmH/NrfG